MSEFFKEHKKDIIFILIIIALIICCICSINTCSKNKKELNESNHNVDTLLDSVSTYKAKNDNLVYQNEILIGDKELLEKAYGDLAEELKNMKVKNWEQAVQIQAIIENPQRDTIWKYEYVQKDTTVIRNFDFNDMPYRELNGFVAYNSNDMLMKIEKDKVYFDYTLAIKDGKVYITSSNPYVTINEIKGITEPKPKQKHWGLGITGGINCGYDLINKKFYTGPGIGLSVSYNFLTW